MENLTKFKNIFKWISFGILIIVTTTTLIALVIQGETGISDTIYGINKFLCVISLIAIAVYLIGIRILKSDESHLEHSHRKKKTKFEIKPFFRKTWPCILLIIFVLWTAVGCIQASMEAAAEAALVDEIKENDTERNKEIAAWSSTNRMKNAADRAWNGCNNLKDGYFSFLFYATVAINVIILGKNSDNLKKYILRVFLVTSFIIVLFSFLTFFDPIFLDGAVKFNRAIFNNSNHYGYYLCLASMVSAMLFIKEKNLYFKILSLLAFTLTAFMLIVNNTFGAYLGVMVAIAIVTICALVNLIYKFMTKHEKLKEGIKDFVCTAIITTIYTFFSCIIISASSKVSTQDEKIYIEQYLITTLGQYNVYTVRSDESIVIKETSFELSGDNRIYATNQKVLQLVKSNDKFDKNANYYKMYGVLYKAIKEETTTNIKTPEEYNSKTIVKTNFEQLGKDIGIIFGFYNSEETTESTTIENNTENVNEKSGLTEEVSNTGSGRGEVWIKSLDLIKQRPIFGWGLENLLNEFYYQYDINEGRTHNLILQLAGTTGIFGMLFYMVAVIAIFFKTLRRHRNWDLIEFVAVPTFIAYMVSSMFGNSAFYTSPYFMIILGIMIATTLYKEKE